MNLSYISHGLGMFSVCEKRSWYINRFIRYDDDGAGVCFVQKASSPVYRSVSMEGSNLSFMVTIIAILNDHGIVLTGIRC